ncbi:N-acyl-D-amino-acid deacylase family protein [Cupriavidus malaysiensis]|uniref:Amidohydrolase n=1 Tax=Cupriavidus malaysiensis TaxID=367825 RepID=A0A1D9HZK9_9BURK|nr:amidohydrolase family protein [Cupriavidus malaysiensis]AOZ05307.1 amidohydrolase [Cupriavidus malaysiensis]
MYDLVIRGGTLVDGSGAPARTGDLAIQDGIIQQAGGSAGPARRVIDASGCLVTPGWVDIHTHYDGQATWDPYLTPSTWHGVTTAIMGNCGVGFAPVRPQDRDWLIRVMEGVEDIPGAVLSEGIQWDWESFPQYLDALARRPKALDIGAQVPHSALRTYVMGERGVHHDEATPEDIQQMCALLGEAMRAGALGFSTSRTFLHKYEGRKYPPGTFATLAEIGALGETLGAAGHGVFQMTSNHVSMDGEIPWLRKLARHNRLPVLFNLQQTDPEPDLWQTLLAALEDARAQDIPLFGGICGRPLGLLFSWETSLHPFIQSVAYQRLQGLPFAQRIAALRQPDTRHAILHGERTLADKNLERMFSQFSRIYPMEARPDYEPAEDKSVASLARQSGRDPLEVIYDLMLEQDGKAILYYPSFNYSYGELSQIHAMLQTPSTVNSLADGGAHCGYICDVSMPTFMLTHWTRDRRRGPRLSVEAMVRRQTLETARLYGLHDRGLLQPGKKADINVIDYARLNLHAPRMVYDLPAGGRRLVQDADGYVATLVAGMPIFEHGQATGELPGRLLRGAAGGAR